MMASLVFSSAEMNLLDLCGAVGGILEVLLATPDVSGGDGLYQRKEFRRPRSCGLAQVFDWHELRTAARFTRQMRLG